MIPSLVLFPTRLVSYVVVLLCVAASSASAQFNLPLPAPPSAAAVFADDMQMDFVSWMDSEVDWDLRVDTLRALAIRADEKDTAAANALQRSAKKFCEEDPRLKETKCVEALTPAAILARFGRTGNDASAPGERYIPLGFPVWSTRRPRVAKYARASGGDDGFSIVPQFASNVSENEAYVVTSVIRGLIGRGIFSVDQALVIARSDEDDPKKRKSIESEKANILRAVNNGGTLVARFTMPFYAVTSSTASRAAGLVVSGGVIGPVSDNSADTTKQRYAAGSASLETIWSFPIRGLSGLSDVLGDLMLGGRIGYTLSGGSLRTEGGFKDVGLGQFVLGIRQSKALSVSALVTFANHGFNETIPRIGINLAAKR
jgi:hypothetical protein